MSVSDSHSPTRLSRTRTEAWRGWIVMGLAALCLGGGAAVAGSVPSRKTLPPPPSRSSPAGVPSAIWGAIAYSPASGVDGIFWGGASREEAETLANRHCQRAEASAKPDLAPTACRIVSTFYNGRTESTPEKPWPHCGALARNANRWSAAFGLTQDTAVENALRACGTGTCTVVEKVCT